MAIRNENKGHNSTQSGSGAQAKPANPMKSVQTKPLPTKKVFFSENTKKQGNNHSHK